MYTIESIPYVRIGERMIKAGDEFLYFSPCGAPITVKVVGIAMAKNGDSAAFAVFLEGQGLGVIVKDVRELDEKIDRGQYVPVREE